MLPKDLRALALEGMRKEGMKGSNGSPFVDPVDPVHLIIVTFTSTLSTFQALNHRRFTFWSVAESSLKPDPFPSIHCPSSYRFLSCCLVIGKLVWWNGCQWAECAINEEIDIDRIASISRPGKRRKEFHVFREPYFRVKIAEVVVNESFFWLPDSSPVQPSDENLPPPPPPLVSGWEEESGDVVMTMQGRALDSDFTHA